MKRVASKLLIVVVAAAAWVGGYGYGRWYGPGAGRNEAKKTTSGYHCPMHPAFRSAEPGNCGICGMRLVPDEEPKAASPPGHEGHAAEAAPPALPPGAIHVSAAQQQLIGVRFGTAEYTASAQSFRAVGKVAADETRISKVQTRVDGWIEEVFVDFTGKQVAKGSPMLTLYSPEMLATQQEFLLAVRGQHVLQSSALQTGRDHGASLVEAARRRLELWDLSGEQIAEIERTGRPIRNITVFAPIAGYVTERNALPKQKVTPDAALYTLTDLSHIWIFAEVFESDAGMVREGMPAAVTLTYAGGQRIGAKVTYIQPAVDPATRTLRVRLEAPNPSLALKPEMFVDVEFHAGGTRRLTVPAEAVLDTGLRKTVFVDRGGGHFEPREIRTGTRMGERIEVVSGLKDGDRVVTSGNFLIDSESRLKSAASGHAHD